jgi:ubiquinone/menaquinone biosynthesis C-methylase UbiE
VPVDLGAWRWDETLYAGSARYYRAGRLPYEAAVADALAHEAGLDGTQRLLDVGCGPGSLTLLLAPRVALAVGIDADRDMIAAAADEAERARIDNVRWLHLRAEALPAGLGRFDVVTFAQSFHWMEREAVAAATRRMLGPRGVCVHVQATTHRGDESADRLAHPRPPHAQIRDLVRDYLGAVPRAGQGRLPTGTPSGEDEIFRSAGFAGPHRVELDTARVVTRSEDEIVAMTFSLSSAAPHLFGARLPAFEADLRRLLRRTSPDGVFAERTRAVALDLWQLSGA